MTSLPSAAQSTAVSASKAMTPTAAPGETFRPLASRSPALRDSDAELRMQEEVDLIRSDPPDRFFLRDETLFGHLDRDAHRGLCGALAVTGLEQPELAALDGELHVLHVPVVLLELVGGCQQLVVDAGHVLFHVVEREGRPDTGNDVLALGVHQVVTLDVVLAGSTVTGHGNAGSAVVAQVAEHHRLHVDGSTEVVGDVGSVAVVDGPPAVPRLEDGLDGQLQLLVGIQRELRRDLDEALHDLLQRFGGEIGIDGNAGLLAELGEDLLVRLVRLAEHDRAEHLDEAAVTSRRRNGRRR